MVEIPAKAQQQAATACRNVHSVRRLVVIGAAFLVVAGLFAPVCSAAPRSQRAAAASVHQSVDGNLTYQQHASYGLKEHSSAKSMSAPAQRGAAERSFIGSVLMACLGLVMTGFVAYWVTRYRERSRRDGSRNESRHMSSDGSSDADWDFDD